MPKKTKYFLICSPLRLRLPRTVVKRLQHAGEASSEGHGGVRRVCKSRLAQAKPEGVSQLMSEVITQEPDAQRVSAAHLYDALSQVLR